MSTGYALAYRLHLTPWERGGRVAAATFAQLLDREESERARPLGRALDVGCGTGAHSVTLARRGWQVTGIDDVARAVRAARRRAAEAGVEVTFLEADATALTVDQLGDDVDLVLDVGCLHGLGREQLARAGEGLTRVTHPGATMLQLAFRPGRRGPLPRGLDRSDLARALPLWDVTDEQAADASGLPAPIRRAAPTVYRLRRREGAAGT